MDLKIRKPDFLIIGAQKAATTWLWNVINAHPDTDLPHKKEIHYFGGIEHYNKGREWYYKHFSNLNRKKITGEASTSYLFDHIPYWGNTSNLIEFDESLPTIPELISNELPNVKILVILRDPVIRAISSYKHNMRKANRVNISTKLSLQNISTEYPKFRILEYGFYAKYLQIWKQFIPPERMLILIYEEDIINSPEQTISTVYEFLGLDKNYNSLNFKSVVHKSWSWTRILINYYTKPYFSKLIQSKCGTIFDKYDFLSSFAVSEKDIEFLRNSYLPEHAALEAVIGRKIDCWRYGR